MSMNCRAPISAATYTNRLNIWTGSLRPKKDKRKFMISLSSESKDMALNNEWKKSRFVLLFSQSTQLLFHEGVGDDYCECFSSKGVIVREANFLTKDVACMQKG